MKLAIFGDSHFACVKQALDAGLVNTDGFEIEFWGHAGRRFRTLYFDDGAVRCKDPVSAQKFSNANVHGRKFLPVADFDHILFVGARISVFNIFAAHATWESSGNFASTGLRQRHIRDHLERFLGYKIARSAAAGRKAKILLFPISFPTQGRKLSSNQEHGDFIQATPKTRFQTWQDIRAVGGNDDIEILRQPEETILEGLFTDEKYAVLDPNDYAHKNKTYGALILSHALESIKAADNKGEALQGTEKKTSL
jgi:hypothetical protein